MKPVCLITGAGGRLGNALCQALVNEFDIIATYNKTLPKLDSQLVRAVSLPTDTTVHPTTEPIFCIQADLTKREDIRRLVEVSLAKYNRIDVVINSAADLKFHGKLLELAQAEEYAQSQFALNSVIPFQLISAIHSTCWKDSRKDNAFWNRCVINVSSKSGMHVYPTGGQAFYSASKAALNILTLHLALELAPYSVRANAVCPGGFTDQATIRPVVEAIKAVITGSDTGVLVAI
jgi:NAD(P)-dependent dehydrogenase (short-subunit alcohol dehydrogenase family)